MQEGDFGDEWEDEEEQHNENCEAVIWVLYP